jgi:hypothetical protein
VRPNPKRTAKQADSVDPAAVEGPVADGLLIARQAATIAVANEIIVGALREGHDFNHDAAADWVRLELDKLAQEQTELAAHLTTTRTKAIKSRGRSRHQFDYRREDDEPLLLRESISTAIAARLDELRRDDAYVDDIVTAARDRAWHDIGGAIMSRVTSVIIDEGDYEEHRDDRIHELIDIDLKELLSSIGE